APDPLAPRSPHFAPRAKRVIFLFMTGGPSHIDTFDYKPSLQRDDGKPLPFAKPRVQFAETGKLLGSPWKFKRYGESGSWVSELFPHVATCVDDLCFLHSLHGTNAAHGGALLKLHTGSDNFVRPSMGSWLTYGLGTENANLPGFITICPTLAHGGVKNWGSAFLPAPYQGTPLGNASIPADKARVSYIKNSHITPNLQRLQLDMLAEVNRDHLAQGGADQALEGRLESFEPAFRMQTEMPEIEDISDEAPATRKAYGLDDPVTANFGRQCLLARRFSERGVRFVELIDTGSSGNWDSHGNMMDHVPLAKNVDRAIAGLITDLKSRGMLDDTLVVWTTEFGRTPYNSQPGAAGREHHHQCFSSWLAGGGVKPGIVHGATDELGIAVADGMVHVHDFHATILHLLGIDHERLTYRHAGRDYRLTDVSGNVVKEILS
ncbi:DUF1501 domain-containing protein, partial [Singulisphaera rosea]